MKRWKDWGVASQSNVDRTTKVVVGNIIGDVRRPLTWLVIERNGCKYGIFLYVQYSYRWTNFKGSKISNSTPYQLVSGKLRNIQLLVPITTLPLKNYVLREGRELPTHDLIPHVFKVFSR